MLDTKTRSTLSTRSDSCQDVKDQCLYCLDCRRCIVFTRQRLLILLLVGLCPTITLILLTTLRGAVNPKGRIKGCIKDLCQSILQACSLFGPCGSGPQFSHRTKRVWKFGCRTYWSITYDARGTALAAIWGLDETFWHPFGPLLRQVALDNCYDCGTACRRRFQLWSVLLHSPILLCPR